MDTELRVLHAFNLYGNPSEIWGFRLLESLHEAGVRQGIVTAQYWPGHFPDRPWPMYRLPVVSEYHPHGYLQRQLSYLLTTGWLLSEIKKGDWHLLHAHFGTAGWRFASLAARLGIPLAVSFYGTDYQSVPARNPMWRRRYRTLFEQAVCVFSEGPYGAGLLEAMGCPPEKIQIQRLGVLPGPEPLAKFPKHAGRLRLVQVASFVEKKGQEDTLRAFALALPDCPEATLTLAGDGSRARSDMEVLAFTLGIRSKVTFRDFVPYGQLRDFLSGFDVFIHPSRQAMDLDSEGGIPTIIFEAMAAGLPVISTRHCDIPQVVLHGQTGFCTPERDIDQLSSFIRTFYRMTEGEIALFRQAARNHVVRNFDIRGAGAELAEKYEGW